MNKIKKRITELEKGCRKRIIIGTWTCNFKCGEHHDELTELCSKCKAELKGFKEALKLKDEEIKEKIDELKEEDLEEKQKKLKELKMFEVARLSLTRQISPNDIKEAVEQGFNAGIYHQINKEDRIFSEEKA